MFCFTDYKDQNSNFLRKRKRNLKWCWVLTGKTSTVKKKVCFISIVCVLEDRAIVHQHYHRCSTKFQQSTHASILTIHDHRIRSGEIFPLYHSLETSLQAYTRNYFQVYFNCTVSRDYLSKETPLFRKATSKPQRGTPPFRLRLQSFGSGFIYHLSLVHRKDDT